MITSVTLALLFLYKLLTDEILPSFPMYKYIRSHPRFMAGSSALGKSGILHCYYFVFLSDELNRCQPGVEAPLWRHEGTQEILDPLHAVYILLWVKIDASVCLSKSYSILICGIVWRSILLKPIGNWKRFHQFKKMESIPWMRTISRCAMKKDDDKRGFHK